MSLGRPRASSRAFISDAACELFLERGFEATSVTDIAQRAGVSRSSFFNYFPSKDAIIWSALDERIDVLGERLREQDVTAALHAVADGLRPDALALALTNAQAMGMESELDRAAALRAAAIASTVAQALTGRGMDPVEAAVAGAAHGGAVMAAIRAWAAAGAGRTTLASPLAVALARAARTLH
ncbi:TetR family transcriptional regulator [Microbacterium dauci]|uniref:TetR family transcriptional regulator n=1 Tax=Microbacterium dauci TaxID=3048008 RepID=A0ABT6ZBU4_9MICO|nr:TetR family transcriptional regulator [Microbacterium sp. LX3-4]MDJ1113629.1 TetR family transcriptional regulator [Microbacterium sp. LX3-4]